MSLLPYCKNQVSLDHVWNLFCFPFKDYLITVSHAFFYFNLQLFLIGYYSFTSAMRAILGANFTFCTTPITLSLHLHLHAKAYLNHLHYNTLAFALWTCLCFPIFSTSSSTFGAINIPAN